MDSHYLGYAQNFTHRTHNWETDELGNERILKCVSMWRSLILSTMTNATFLPYCVFIRSLNIHILGNVLADLAFKETVEEYERNAPFLLFLSSRGSSYLYLLEYSSRENFRGSAFGRLLLVMMIARPWTPSELCGQLEKVCFHPPQYN